VILVTKNRITDFEKDIMKKAYQVIADSFEYTSTFFLLCILIVVILQVFFRYVAQIVVPWTEELARYLCIWMVFMGATAAVAKSAHIQVTFIIDRVPNKIRNVFDLFSLVVVFLFNLIVFLGSIQLVQMNWGQQAVTFPASIGVLYLSITISSFFILLFLIVQLIVKMKEVLSS
jgi:TRAP-type C4-dicarboxylate transport system permease small subunit